MRSGICRRCRLVECACSPETMVGVLREEIKILRAALKPFAESWNTDPTKRYPEHIQCLPIGVWVEAREAYLETEDE